MDHIDGTPLRQRHVQRVEHELGLEIMAHCPADDAAREGIQHDSQIQEPGPGRDVGDVRDPQPVRLIGVEVPVDQIAGGTNPLVPQGRTGALAAADANEAGRSHQPFDPLAADRDAFIDEFGVDARRPIGCSGGLVDRLDAGCELGTGTGPGARRAPEPGVGAGT